MLSEVGWLINTAVLLFVAGLMVGYGKWLGGQIMTINETLAKWSLRVAAIERCEAKLNTMDREFAVHKVSAHCGEKEKKA
jgi:hypothetical protein